MKILLTSMLLLSGLCIQAAASSEPEQMKQLVVLHTIKNGVRHKKAEPLSKSLRSKSSCNNTINGVLFGCIDPITHERHGVLELDIDPPRKGEHGPEKEVHWPIPVKSHCAKDHHAGHIRTNYATSYITRSSTHVLLTHKKRGEFVVKDKPVFEIPKDISIVLLLLEISTGGEFIFSQLPVDKTQPQQLVPSTTHPSPYEAYSFVDDLKSQQNQKKRY